MAVLWCWTAIIMLLVTFWKKLFRPIEAVPGGTRKQTGLPCETLLDRGPLLSVLQGQMASPLDEGRTPWMYSGECQYSTFLLLESVSFPSRLLARACGARLIYYVLWNRREAPVPQHIINCWRGKAAPAAGERG